MSDSQIKNIGKIQPAKKPTKDKINSAYQHSSPRSQMSWGEIHTSQHVGKNNQIACEIVYFHCDSPRRPRLLRPCVIQTEIELLLNNKLKSERLVLHPSKLAMWGLRRRGQAEDRRYVTVPAFGHGEADRKSVV